MIEPSLYYRFKKLNPKWLFYSKLSHPNNSTHTYTPNFAFTPRTYLPQQTDLELIFVLSSWLFLPRQCDSIQINVFDNVMIEDVQLLTASW